MFFLYFSIFKVGTLSYLQKCIYLPAFWGAFLNIFKNEEVTINVGLLFCLILFFQNH